MEITEAERELFLEETNEHLQSLEEGLLRLERGERDSEILAAIFRSAHTIKGGAATLGLEAMTNLTHVMESRFDRFRSGSDIPTPETIDALLAATDCLKELAARLAEGTSAEVDIENLITKLTVDAAMESISAAPSIPLTTDSSEHAQWQVTANIADDCPMPAVRALQILLALDGIGQVVGSVPLRSEIEAERVQRQITVWLAGASGRERISAAVSTVPEIISTDIEPVSQRSDPSADGQRASDRHGDSGTVRINVGILDDLMNLVGELVIGRGQLAALGEQIAARPEVSDLGEELARLSTHLARVTGSIQDSVLKARMLPLSRVFQRLPRLVRDLSRTQDKPVELVIRGEDTELDRSVLELLGDPLIHIVRNAIDHGIEPPDERERSQKPRVGVIQISGGYEESRVVISVTDDGRGLDPDVLRRGAVERGLLTTEAAAELPDREAVELIFSPGFSTASQVTEVSGRGVGMDVVKRNIEQTGGHVLVSSTRGQGTEIRLVLPLTLATLRVLLLDAGGNLLAAPLSAIQETLHVVPDEVQYINKRPHTLVRDQLIPLVWLNDLYQARNGKGEIDSRLTVVLARHATGTAGMVVDGLIGEHEVVIKRLGDTVGSIRGIGGATILGDGSVALILDVPGAIRVLSARG